VDIGEIIGQTLEFLEKEAERRFIRLSINQKTPVPHFESDKGCLQQIFLNLFNNAFDAMENGGHLEIEIMEDTTGNIVITVSDTGKGIAREDLDKIFEPFYSSKNNGWGTGHGLSITYGLVKEIQGEILVNSSLGKGTCFTLIFPVKANHVNG